MENILFSNTPAEELNKLVRTKIAEHLFLICHYEPCVNVFSEDAKFVAGCLNLYKAVIDSSCIIRKLTKKGWLKNNEYPCEASEDLRACVDTIKVLRTAWAHNQSEETNDIEKQKYDQWVQRHLRKEKPTTTEDYAVLLKSLEELGGETYEMLCKCIESLEKNPQRMYLIQSWENATFEWYTSSANQAIFLNQLYAWCAADPKFEGRSKTTLKRDAASMIEEYYTKGEKIKRLEGLLECIGRAPKLEDKIAELREEKALAERKAKSTRIAQAHGVFKTFCLRNWNKSYAKHLMRRSVQCCRRTYYSIRLKQLQKAKTVVPEFHTVVPNAL